MRNRTVALGSVSIVAAVALFVGLSTPDARASVPIVSYAATPSTAQAGGHPDVVISFRIKNRFDQASESACNCEDLKDAIVHLPTGFVGNPSATPQCSMADFSADECPLDSVIGAVEVDVGLITFVSVLYNVVPPPDVAGLTVFKTALLNVPQFTILSARTDSDYGLDANTTSIFHGSILPLKAFKQVLWGVPADPKHDPLRIDTEYTQGHYPSVFGGKFCNSENSLSTDDPLTVERVCGGGIPPSASNSPAVPFLQNPTTCDALLSTHFEAVAYDGGIEHASRPWPQGTGCSQLAFNPSLFAKPTTEQTDSASGLDVNLVVPQPLSPEIPSPSELREATLTLPPGFSINSNAADGKVACDDAEAMFGTLLGATCPEFAKLGSVEIHSSALPGPLPGAVYLGKPLPGERYRVFLVADGFATHIKLPGTVNPDPRTGQLSISFKNLPQSPLNEFDLHFFGAERGALATPTRCGTYPVTSTFVPWNSRTAPQTSTQYFTVTSGPGGASCPEASRPFAPRFSAASEGNTGGAFVPFSTEFSRSDGEQYLSDVALTTPPGFAASLRGLHYCPESAISRLTDPDYLGLTEQFAPLCPAASRVGTAVVGTGAGSRPLYVSGNAYLAGPYKGAPLSLVVATPAVSGPYDLGNVVVRAAIDLDPRTAQVTTSSDVLPQIIDGIPLRVRSVRLKLDRPHFAVNPTNCKPMSVRGVLEGDEGGVAQVEHGYQVANCASLPFAPKMAIRFSGGVNRRGHPAIHAVLSSKPGEANLRRVSVTLPEGQLLDNSRIGNVCTKVDFAKNSCPASSRIGEARITTPLLDDPLTGAVYLRSSQHKLPDLALDLRGQFDIEAIGRVESYRARLRTTFEALPDAPTSRIDVVLAGGRKGLLSNSEGLCGRSRRAKVAMTGQNGMTRVTRPELDVDCGSKGAAATRRGGKR
jgi:hypothetical protein